MPVYSKQFKAPILANPIGHTSFFSSLDRRSLFHRLQINFCVYILQKSYNPCLYKARLKEFLRASPPKLSNYVTLQKYFSHIQVLVPNFFPTPPIKLKLGLRVHKRLLIANHLDQSL